MSLSPDQIVIYVGPSLAVQDARQVLDADYRPPIRRGDINALMASPPKIIGVVDGKFFQSFAISPKEMLPAIEAGILMLGSSSMGALRAAELYPFGMIGVGRIFELYKSGEIDADDEVAMVFDEENGRAHSVPMVNIRVTLERALAEGVISAASASTASSLIRNVYFPERSYPMLLRVTAGKLPEQEHAALRSYLQRPPDAKREDALSLLREVERLATAL